MERVQAEEILACLATGRRRLFRYYKDRYAFLLLQWAAEAGERCASPKSPFARLLDKPIVRERKPDFVEPWPARPQSYRLSLDLWGEGKIEWRWHQMTRPGVSLVLQINFTGEHDDPYHSLVKPTDYHPFVFFFHPVREDRQTMAWVRIDADLDTGEALIEEVQNDWFRKARYGWDLVCRYRAGERSLRKKIISHFSGTKCRYIQLRRYMHDVLPAYERTWAEASLAAAIEFIRNELGLHEIYMHTHASGNRLKHMSPAPVSLYEQLPKRFCFRRTEAAPVFLRESRNRAVRRRVRHPGTAFWFLRV